MKRPPTAKMYRSVLDDLYAEALAQEEKKPRARVMIFGKV